MKGFRGWNNLWAAAFLAALTLSSCRTLPEAPYPDIVDWVSDDADLLLRLKVQGNHDLTDILLSAAGVDPSKMASARERTAVFAAGVVLGEEWIAFDSAGVSAAAVGRYPRGVLGGALGKDWRRDSSERYRWIGPNGLQLAAVSKEEILLSRGGLERVIANREKSISRPTALDPFDGSDLAIALVDSNFIDELVPLASGRIHSLGVGLTEAESDLYTVDLRIYPADPRLAGSLALALRIGISARFGLSPVPAERALLDDMEFDIVDGEVRIGMPSVPIEVLESLLESLLAEAEA